MPGNSTCGAKNRVWDFFAKTGISCLANPLVSDSLTSGKVACVYENRVDPNCCGEQWDADLGLYYNRARYLNTDSGRFWSQDEYRGNNSTPSTLHKYIYANANPVKYSDPSGYLSRAVRALIGMEVHARIGAHFKSFDPGNRHVNSVTLGVILNRFDDDSDLELKPDLVDDANSEMYEIKPDANGRGSGRASRQVGRYISVTDRYGRIYCLGDSYTPPTTVRLSPLFYRVRAEISRDEPGVVLYKLYERDESDNVERVAVAATALTLAHLSRMISVGESARQAGINGRLVISAFTGGKL